MKHLDNSVCMNMLDDDLKISHIAYSNDSTNTENYQKYRRVLSDPNHSIDKEEFPKMNAPSVHDRQPTIDMTLDSVDSEVDASCPRINNTKNNNNSPSPMSPEPNAPVVTLILFIHITQDYSNLLITVFSMIFATICISMSCFEYFLFSKFVSFASSIILSFCIESDDIVNMSHKDDVCKIKSNQLSQKDENFIHISEKVPNMNQGCQKFILGFD